MSSHAILGKAVELDHKIARVTERLVHLKVLDRSTFDKLKDSVSSAVAALTPGASDGK